MKSLFLISLCFGLTLGVDYETVSRAQWNATSPVSTTSMATPVPYVIIHHTSYEDCTTEDECVRAVQRVQKQHMDGYDYPDIGFNFLVGGDMRVYVGRGWTTMGQHASVFNSDSIGIAFVGDFIYTLPPAMQMEVVKSLISNGIKGGYVMPTYKLLGHRQTSSETDCPGQALYKEITTWPHYASSPWMANENEKEDNAY